MDLIIYTQAKDKQAEAAVTSITDTTPVENLEQLVLGDNAPLSVVFTDGSASPSWAGAVGYTMAVGLGIRDINGQSDAVFTNDVTAITGGWSCTLSLTTQQIVDQLALATGSSVDWTRYPMQSRLPRPRPQGGFFCMQIVVTDPDGNRVTYATLNVFLLNRVIAVGTVAPQPPTEYLTAAESISMFQPLDADLTAIAALSTTAYGRAVLALANAAALATYAGVGTADSPTIAALTTTGNVQVKGGRVTLADLLFPPYIQEQHIDNNNTGIELWGAVNGVATALLKLQVGAGSVTSTFPFPMYISVAQTPSAPMSGLVLYCDTSAGKFRLMARFPTGSAQVISTEP